VLWGFKGEMNFDFPFCPFWSVWPEYPVQIRSWPVSEPVLKLPKSV